MARANIVVFYGYIIAGGENAIFQNFQKSRDMLTHIPFVSS